ncbi:hypothetical protein GQ607_014082 [Colletotrichum asianum]|uniref:C3H1-type domain-containing protein n=1 Tax=Colletotrichum asianum TaxID=702518 RepID=A0A8H3W3U2_9PEZI|nr:hypothetical protein GQ607_014082 [Colletotrichum asianum]
MEELSRELDGKLKLEEVPESDPKSQSDPVRQQPDSGRPYHFSGLGAAPEDGVETSERPNEEASQKPDAVEALTKEIDGKLKLESDVAASSKVPRPPGEASSIPETEATSLTQKPRQTFSFTFDEGNLRTAADPERSTGDQPLNPSAPVWTPSPSTTKEHPLPIRLREGPSQHTSSSEETLKHETDVQRSVATEGHSGTKTQIKATSSESRVVDAKADRQSQTLCRNVVIYGHCRNEGVGCAFKHP